MTSKIARRSLLLGLGAAIAAPAVIRTPGMLMPVRTVPKLVLPVIRRVMPEVIAGEIVGLGASSIEPVISIARLRMRFYNRLYAIDPAAAEALTRRDERERELYRRDEAWFGPSFAHEIRDVSIAKDPMIAEYSRIISQAEASHAVA